MGRLEAIAVRCQLLTGSYEGATHCCECFSTKQCALTETEMAQFRDHPKVLEAYHRNLKEYQELNKDQECK